LDRTAEYAVDTDVGPRTGNRILGHVAVAAEQLQAVIDDLVDPLRGPEFGHRRSLHVELAAQVLFDALIEIGTDDRRLRRLLGEGELGILKLEDLPAERLALLGVLDR